MGGYNFPFPSGREIVVFLLTFGLVFALIGAGIASLIWGFSHEN